MELFDKNSLYSSTASVKKNAVKVQMNTCKLYRTTKNPIINSYSEKNLLLIQLSNRLVSNSNSINSEFELKFRSSFQTGLRLNFTNNLDTGKLTIPQSKQFPFSSLNTFSVIPDLLRMFCWCLILILIIYKHEDKDDSHR